MKKFIPLLLTMAVALFAWNSFTPTHAQEPANEEKPTFYRLTPGVYVNGWPRFTVSYPKDWVEQRPRPEEAFRARTPGPVPYPALGILVGPYPLPLDKFADTGLTLFRTFFTDVTLVSDKPSRLRDGTPAREIEYQFVVSGAQDYYLTVATKKDDLLIHVDITSRSGIGEDLKAILYSLEFQPGKDEPVKVPPDVQELFDRHNNDIVSHDLAKVMTHYSDKYLNSGMKKIEMERFLGLYIGVITLSEMTITEFVPAGDRAYLTGFGTTDFGKGRFKFPIRETSIIKENGEWKWYGNQRDVSP